MNFNSMVKSGYFMYMAETEGLTNIVNTRTAKINAAIKDFKYIVNQGEDPNDYIDKVLEKYGLSERSLSPAECRRIMEAVNGH